MLSVIETKKCYDNALKLLGRGTVAWKGMGNQLQIVKFTANAHLIKWSTTG